LLAIGIGALQLFFDRGQSLDWFGSLEVQVEIKKICTLKRTPRGGTVPEALLPEIGLAVSQACGEPLARPHSSEHDLWTVGSAAGIKTLFEAAFDERVDLVDERRLALGPEFGDLLVPCFSDRFRPRRGHVRGRLLRVRRRTGQEQPYDESRPTDVSACDHEQSSCCLR